MEFTSRSSGNYVTNFVFLLLEIGDDSPLIERVVSRTSELGKSSNKIVYCYQ